MPPFKLSGLSSKWVLYLVVAAVGILGLAARVSERLAYTGDEPRYLLYALSFKIEGRAVMSESGYEKIRNEKTPGVELVAHPLKDIQPGSTPTIPSWCRSFFHLLLQLCRWRSFA